MLTWVSTDDKYVYSLKIRTESNVLVYAVQNASVHGLFM